MAKVDLHLHTTFSDGTLTPTELVLLCKNNGLEIISITDHDSTEGIPEAIELVNTLDQLTLITGVELSTDIPGNEIHLLGYFVDYRDSSFQEMLKSFRDGRRDRALRMIDKLNDMGIKISWETVKKLAGDGAIGRPHIAQAMVEQGYVEKSKDAFDKYIGRNGPAYQERIRLTPQEAIKTLVSLGAIPVMAHPTYAMDDSSENKINEFVKTLKEFKNIGLAGIEVYYRDYSPGQIKLLKKIADEVGLIPCGGSDYHGNDDPDEPKPGSVGPPISTVESLLRYIN